MGIWKDIKDRLIHPNGFTAADEKPNPKGLRYKVQRQYNYRVEADMKKYRLALDSAESPLVPDRRNLYSIYKQIELDDHVAAQVRVAKMTVKQSSWDLKGGDAELLDKGWFFEYLEKCVETEMWGHSLLEFNPTMRDGEFSDLLLLPREHVRPEYGDIRLATSDPVGVPYRDGKYKFLVEIGKAWDLGLYKVVAIPAIRKRYSDSDWSLYSERFGMPFVTVRTASRQENELKEKEEMLKNLGSNGWAILDSQDEVEFLDAKGNSTPHSVYLERIKLAEEQISKIINGQTGTSDEKSFVGSAEVHERMLDKFTFSRLTWIQHHINDVLLPFLTFHGYPLGSAKFQFKDLLPPDPATMQSGQEPQPTKPTQPQKKKTLSVDDMDALYLGLQCGHGHHSTLSFQHPGAAHKGLADRVWSGNVTENDPATWLAYFEAVAEGITEATGQEWRNLDKSGRDYEMLKKMRWNAAEFAAAKMSKVIDGLKQARTAANRSRAVFDEAATKLLDKHAEWLQTEYDQAVATAQMGIKWQDLTENIEPGDMLRYVTVGDGRVRPLHRVLDGATQPPDDPFWNDHCPPLGYRCRCTLVKVNGAAPKSPLREPTQKEAPDAFRFNPGKTGRLFSSKHPYFKGAAVAAIAAAMIAETQTIFEDESTE